MNLVIATPYRNSLTSEYLLSLLDTLHNIKKLSTIDKIQYINCSGTFIHVNRNILVENFLKTDGDALLFIDSDIQFKKEDVEEIVNLDKPVVSGLYMSRWMNYPVVFRLLENDKMINVRIDEIPEEPFCWDNIGVGCGFLLIKRSVLELFKTNAILKSMGKPFDFMLSQEHGEDMYFCRRLNAIKMPIWVHSGVKVGHVGKKVYYPIVEDMMMSEFLGGMMEDKDY